MIDSYILGLVDYMYKKLADIPQVSIVGNFEERNRSGIMYINFPAEWNLTNDILKENGIRAQVSGKSIRIGIHYFNNTADLDKLADFLAIYKG